MPKRLLAGPNPRKVSHCGQLPPASVAVPDPPVDYALEPLMGLSSSTSSFLELRSPGVRRILAFTLFRGCPLRFFGIGQAWVVPQHRRNLAAHSAAFFRMPSTMPDGQSCLRAREHDRPKCPLTANPSMQARQRTALQLWSIIFPVFPPLST